MLNGKSVFLYIGRYINVERLVETSKGSFYFVLHPKGSLANVATADIFNTTVKPNAGTKGKPSSVVLHDTELNLFVEFKSKNKLGLFLTGRKAGGIFHRYLYLYLYLYNDKIYKKRFGILLPHKVPANLVISSSAAYFITLGREQL